MGVLSQRRLARQKEAAQAQVCRLDSNKGVVLLLCCATRQALSSVATAFLASEDLPEAVRAGIVEHMVLVHQSVRRFSAQFAEELRRHNYVTVRVGLCMRGASGRRASRQTSP